MAILPRCASVHYSPQYSVLVLLVEVQSWLGRMVRLAQQVVDERDCRTVMS